MTTTRQSAFGRDTDLGSCSALCGAKSISCTTKTTVRGASPTAFHHSLTAFLSAQNSKRTMLSSSEIALPSLRSRGSHYTNSSRVPRLRGSLLVPDGYKMHPRQHFPTHHQQAARFLMLSSSSNEGIVVAFWMHNCL